MTLTPSEAPLDFYRLYLLDGERYLDCIEILARDEEDAVRQAEARLAGRAGELCCGGRRVRRFAASQALAQA